MKMMIKLELSKAFSGIRFWIAFGIAQVFGALSLMSVYQDYLKNKDYIEYWKERFPVRQCYTLFHAWIMNDPSSIGSTLFFFWLPVLAAFPFAGSCLREEKSRQLCLVLVRTKRGSFFWAKYLAVFASGFLLVSGTLALNLAAAAAIFPYEKPIQFYPYFRVGVNDFLAEQFYSHPAVYAAGYFLISGLYGGLFAGFVYVLTMFTKKQLPAFGIVLLVYVGLDILEKMIYAGLPSGSSVLEWSPYGFFAGTGAEISGWVIAGELLLSFLLQVILIAGHEKTYEIY